MSNLKVTLSSPVVTLTTDTGQVTVSVTNTGLTTERVVLGVYPPLDAMPAGTPLNRAPAPEGASHALAPSTSSGAGSAAGWTQVERPLREIPAGATEQFVVTFDGRDAAPGSHRARFIAYSATRAPEEFSDQAGTVTVTKQAVPVEPAGPRRPWWLLVVAALLVLLVGAVVFFLLRDDGETTPKARCSADLVPRLARPTDLVCVTEASAAQVLYDNNPAVQNERHPTPRGGPYGPETCSQGYVWREAFEGDTVCVDPPTRTRTRQENADAAANAAP